MEKNSIYRVALGSISSFLKLESAWRAGFNCSGPCGDGDQQFSSCRTPHRDILSPLFGADSCRRLELGKPSEFMDRRRLMAVFFLLVGLEIKREVMQGELSTVSQVALPLAAAIGGMVVPAALYFWLNSGDATALRGWAIPMATDIAFALGVISLLGKRVPMSLKVFLTAVAIADDLGAILVIAFVYTDNVSTHMLLFAGAAILSLIALNLCKVSALSAYAIIGVCLWLFVLKSGIHATLAGVIVAFAIPLKVEDHDEQSPLLRLEHGLHPWVAFGVLPIFAFANAGVGVNIPRQSRGL